MAKNEPDALADVTTDPECRQPALSFQEKLKARREALGFSQRGAGPGARPGPQHGRAMGNRALSAEKKDPRKDG